MSEKTSEKSGRSWHWGEFYMGAIVAVAGLLGGSRLALMDSADPGKPVDSQDSSAEVANLAAQEAEVQGFHETYCSIIASGTLTALHQANPGTVLGNHESAARDAKSDCLSSEWVAHLRADGSMYYKGRAGE